MKPKNTHHSTFCLFGSLTIFLYFFPQNLIATISTKHMHILCLLLKTNIDILIKSILARWYLDLVESTLLLGEGARMHQ
jgi:hypothetical protein